MTAELWMIEARDPFIARDGRPFDNTPGARAASLSFPYPSTTTGGVRTRAGFGSLGGGGPFGPELASAVREIAVRGPLLVELGEGGEVVNWLAPAPADALLLGDGNTGKLVPLVPLALGAGLHTDLPPHLALVGMRERAPSKPHPGAPRFWRWREFERWLADSPAGDSWVDPHLLGHAGLTPETRTHVRIDYGSKSHDPGGLFQTRGLEFVRADAGGGQPRRLALAVEVDGPARFEGAISEGLAPLGGERRVVSWRRGDGRFPACPTAVRESIMGERHCRLVLVTPAHFERGFEPSWLQGEHFGVRAVVRAMAVGHPQVISGWDFEKRRPKPTRRLAPAGTVIFLELRGEFSHVAEWVDQTWMRCVSDGGQDRLDGFGLAALGVWDGRYYEVR